jgi:GNAT superfamily N-acetyltransferase
MVKRAMRSLRTAPDLIDPVVGFRQWRLAEGRLCSPFSDVRWDEAVVDAVCPLGAHGPEDVPAEACSCGIYALYEPCPRTASTATADLVSGAVVVWGTIQLHANGMRAGSCRVIALELPVSRGRKRDECVAVAEALGVPAVRHRELRARAARYGAPLPAALRPPRQRVRAANGRGGPFPVVPAGARAVLTGRPSGIVGAGARREGSSSAATATAELDRIGPGRRRVAPVIRSAGPADAPVVAELLAELGYPEGRDGTAERLSALVARDDAGVLVTEIGGRVAAVAAYQVMTLLERPRPQCRVLTLVVGRQHRRLGLATALLARIEEIAAEQGCFRLEVTTHAGRHAARELYLAAGFQERPRRLVKALGP